MTDMPWTNVTDVDANITEQDVYQKFVDTNMPLLDAIAALRLCGYDEREAERIVFEWIEGLEEPEGGNED